MNGHSITASIVAMLCCTILVSCGRERHRMDGRWSLVAAKSASIDPWTSFTLAIRTNGSSVSIIKEYSAGHPHDRRVDSMTVNMNGGEEVVSVPPGRWLGEVSMGVYYGPGMIRQVMARMNDAHNELLVESRETLQTGQGTIDVQMNESFTLSSDGSTIRWSEARSTRAGAPRIYELVRMTE